MGDPTNDCTHIQPIRGKERQKVDDTGSGVVPRICWYKNSLCRSWLISSPDEDHPPLPYALEIRPSSEFSFNGALNRLENARIFATQPPLTVFWVPGEAENYADDQSVSDIGLTNVQGTLLQLSSRLNMDSRVGIACVGAVLTYLQRKRSSAYLPNDPEAQRAYAVSRVGRFTLRETM